MVFFLSCVSHRGTRTPGVLTPRRPVTIIHCMCAVLWINISLVHRSPTPHTQDPLPSPLHHQSVSAKRRRTCCLLWTSWRPRWTRRRECPASQGAVPALVVHELPHTTVLKGGGRRDELRPTGTDDGQRRVAPGCLEGTGVAGRVAGVSPPLSEEGGGGVAEEEEEKEEEKEASSWWLPGSGAFMPRLLVFTARLRPLLQLWRRHPSLYA